MMGEEMERMKRLRNFLAINLQKMELELKCHSCLSLMNQPLWLPCNHFFCSQCITSMRTNRSNCPVCGLDFVSQDIRPANHMEAIVNIYKSMKSVLGGNLLQSGSQFDVLEMGTPSSGYLVSANTDVEEKPQEPVGIDQVGLIDLLPGGTCFGNTGRDGQTDGPAMHESQRYSGNIQYELLPQREGPSSYTALGEEHHNSDPRAKSRKRRQSAKESPNEELQVESPKRLESDTQESKRKKMNAWASNIGCRSNLSAKDTSNSAPQFTPARKTSPQPLLSEKVECAFATLGRSLRAPKAYFQGDIAMNLNLEISRAAKIKCCHCGQKGAAICCYARKCRKSFHLPCALEISECRWDIENYHLLCPSHASHKLLCDGVKNQKKTEVSSSAFHNRTPSGTSGNCATTPNQVVEGSWAASTILAKGLVLSESFLSSDEKDLVHQFARLVGCDVTRAWTESVTHIIAATDERGACTRTLKVLMGILTGKWILRIDWIKACLEAGNPVPEEPYEITHDVHGCFNGPKNGRIRALRKAPKLFDGLRFHFTGYFMPYYKAYLEDLVTTGGGSVLSYNEIMNSEGSNSEEFVGKTFIIYSVDPPQGCNPEDLAGVIKRRNDEAETLAAKIGAGVVDHTWLLDCVAGCSLPE